MEERGSTGQSSSNGRGDGAMGTGGNGSSSSTGRDCGDGAGRSGRSAVSNGAVGANNGVCDEAAGMDRHGRPGRGMGRGKGVGAEAQEADSSEEQRSCRAQGVNMMATEGGGAWTRAGGAGGNEAGRDGSMSASSCRGYTPCIAILKSSQVFGSANMSLVMENMSQDGPSM